MDLAHDINVIQCLDADITTNTTTQGGIVDTQGYGPGLAFALGLPTAVSGTFTLYLEEGDESDLSDAAEITNIVFSDDADLAAQVADGGVWAKQGTYDTKRYVRASVVSTGISGTNHAVVVCLVDLCVKPAAQG